VNLITLIAEQWLCRLPDPSFGVGEPGPVALSQQANEIVMYERNKPGEAETNFDRIKQDEQDLE